jgi:hypothetical protein
MSSVIAAESLPRVGMPWLRKNGVGETGNGPALPAGHIGFD